MSRKRLVRVGFAGLALAVVVLGAVGLRQYLRTVGGDTSWANVSAGVLNLFGPTGNSLLTSGEVPPSLEFAQLAGPLVTAFAAFELFRGRTERWFRRRRARSRTGHVVLIGCGASGRLIAEQLASRGEPCVIVVDEDAALAKDELFDRPRWAVINGSVSDSSTLVAAGAAHARLVHVATGQDGVDIDVAARLRQLAAPAGDGAMNVKVQIDSSTLCRRLQQEELERVGTDHVIVEYINMSSLSAAAVVEFITTDLFASVDAALDRTMALEVRLVGDTPLVADLASLCIRSHRARAMLGVPTLCQREPTPQDTSTAPAADDRDPNTPFHALTIVQWSDSAKTIDDVARLATDRPDDIVVGLCPAGKKPIRSESRADSGRMVFVDPLSLVETPDLLSYGPVELMARLVHLDYLTTTRGRPDTAAAVDRDWSDLDETYRQANRAQVNSFGEKLHKIGCELSDVRSDSATFADEEIEELARLEHQRWSREREADGWVYGAERDNGRRTHPDLVSYDQLSEAAKDKDRRAVVRIPALAALIGLVVVRSQPR